MTEQDALIRTGMAFIMKTQHADGSWGDRDDKDAYTPYHSTWTAINGLMDYAWAGEGVSFPGAATRAGLIRLSGGWPGRRNVVKSGVFPRSPEPA